MANPDSHRDGWANLCGLLGREYAARDSLPASNPARANAIGSFVVRDVQHLSARQCSFQRSRRLPVISVILLFGRAFALGPCVVKRQCAPGTYTRSPTRYDFHCTAWCGDHHLQMKGVMEIVKD